MAILAVNNRSQLRGYIMTNDECNQWRSNMQKLLLELASAFEKVANSYDREIKAIEKYQQQ